MRQLTVPMYHLVPGDLFEGASDLEPLVIEPCSTVSLGRTNVDIAYDNVSGEQCALRCNVDAKLALKSLGGHPTCVRPAGSTVWHKLLNGETADIFDGDTIALSEKHREATLFVVRATPKGQETLARIREQGDDECSTPRSELTGHTDEQTPTQTPTQRPTMAQRIAQRRQTSSLRRELQSPRGYLEIASFQVGARVIAARTNDEEAHAIIDAFDRRRGLYRIAFVEAEEHLTDRNIAAPQYKMVAADEIRVAPDVPPNVAPVLGKLPLSDGAPIPRAASWVHPAATKGEVGNEPRPPPSWIGYEQRDDRLYAGGFKFAAEQQTRLEQGPSKRIGPAKKLTPRGKAAATLSSGGSTTPQRSGTSRAASARSHATTMSTAAPHALTSPAVCKSREEELTPRSRAYNARLSRARSNGRMVPIATALVAATNKPSGSSTDQGLPTASSSSTTTSATAAAAASANPSTVLYEPELDPLEPQSSVGHDLRAHHD